MVGSALILLREGLEGALIVAIALAYLRKLGRQDRFGAIWTGAGAAIAINDEGENCLHGVAYLGWNTLLQSLVEKGVKVNIVSKRGLTPLSMAEGHQKINNVFLSQPQIVPLLKQADPRANPRETYTAGVAQDASGAANAVAVSSVRAPLVDEGALRTRRQRSKMQASCDAPQRAGVDARAGPDECTLGGDLP